MAERPEEVRPDQVGDGSGEEGRTELPLGRVHAVHHEERERRLQHAHPHVGEGDGAFE